MATTTRVIVILLQTLGGCSPARRAFVAGVFVAVAAGVVPAVVFGAVDDPSVTVVEKGGVYHVATTFLVPQTPGLVTTVLTDYEHIPDFMSDVKVSRVLERGGGRTVVEQEAAARFLFFSRRVHLALEIVETPGHIHFRDICGRSFVQYEGGWHIEAEGTRSRVTYELSAQPTDDVPAVIVRRLLARDVQRTIEQLSREMARRAAQSPAIR